MVHALTEVHRTLQPGGVLLDLRPITSERHLEVVQGDKVTVAGDFDVISLDLDDLAADEAVNHAVEAGLFRLGRSHKFEIAYHWNSVDEMAAFVKDKWSRVNLPSDLEQKARELESAAGGFPRSYVTMTINRLVKIG